MMTCEVVAPPSCMVIGDSAAAVTAVVPVSRVECAFVLQPLQRVAGRFRFVETETIACLEGELDETHAVVERMVAGEAHRRVVGVARGSRGKEEVDARALLVGCGADAHRSAVRLIRIVGIEGLRFGIIEIDGLILGHELTALSHVGYVDEAGAGDADAVAVSPVCTVLIDAGGYRFIDVGGELGGHGAVIQILVVVVAGGQCQCQRCESKKSCLHLIHSSLSYSSALASPPSTVSHPVISPLPSSMPTGVSSVPVTR